MDKTLLETTYLCVEIMNSKRQVHCKRGNLVTRYKFAFDVRRHVMLNVSKGLFI